MGNAEGGKHAPQMQGLYSTLVRFGSGLHSSLSLGVNLIFEP